MGKYLLNYTRKPINEKLYDPKLAYSMHLALKEEDGSFTALNHNSGILFAKATENADGSLNPKSILNPYLFTLRNGEFGVLAIRTGGDGEADEESKGCVIFFQSKDLITYKECGLIKISNQYVLDIRCDFNEEKNVYILSWLSESGDFFQSEVKELEIKNTDLTVRKAEAFQKVSIVTAIEGAVPQNMIEISEECAIYLRARLMPPVNIRIDVPKQINVKNREELSNTKVKAVYSDTSTVMKKVDWDITGVDFSRQGKYEITGRVHREHFDFPVAFDRADPCIGKWKDKYYFIATNDADGNHTLYIREANSIPELVYAEEHLILDSTSYEGIGGLLWAPEFHIVNDKLYIFHAATKGEFFWEESHIMELREGGNPTCKEDWSAPKRIVRRDGSELCEAGKIITLDMTCFEWQKEYYVIWSQREFLPKDLGAWLYIAKLNSQKPWELLTDPVILSKPEYGWANNHTFVDEGPFALLQENRLFVTFSSAAVDSSYVVGLLSIEKGKDLLEVSNWKKENYPILTSRSVEGEFGTGHNAYVIDENEDVWNTYHARPGVDGPRSSGIRRVHFDFEGYPRLDVTEEMDVLDSLREIKTELIVE